MKLPPIKILLDTRIKLLKEVLKKLDGRCQPSCSESCPKNILQNFGIKRPFSRCFWDCRHCNYYFAFLINKTETYLCPCQYGLLSDTIIFRLEEVIKQFEKDKIIYYWKTQANCSQYRILNKKRKLK